MNTSTITTLCLLVATVSANHLANRIGAKNYTGVDGCCKIDEGSKANVKNIVYYLRDRPVSACFQVIVIIIMTAALA